MEEDDGMIDRLLPVAGEEDLSNFQNLFMSKTKKNFTDSHLWVSIFVRPHRSTFTRVQRVSCILSLVMTTMMANAMFYGAEDSIQNKESFILGPFEFTLHGIYISFASSMIILPVNILIDLIFRKTKPKENRITNAFTGRNVKPFVNLSHVKLKVWSPPDETRVEDIFDDDFKHPPPYSANGDDAPPYSANCDDVFDSDFKHPPPFDMRGEDTYDISFKKHHRPFSSISISSADYDNSGHFDKARSSSVASGRFLINNKPKKEFIFKKKKKCRFTLPHTCIYVAWSMVFTTSIISAFITFLYSIQWGKEKSLKWLSNMFLSIFESVVVIQPVKASKV